MYVIKRGGQKQKFDLSKIEKALGKAFRSVNGESFEGVPQILLKEIQAKLGVTKECCVEDIQDIVEDALMNWKFFKEAKAYILYREKHKETRLIADKLNYIHNYEESSQSATQLSNTDDNANSNSKTAATLEGELYKDTNRLVQRAQMKELLEEIKSPYREQYIKDLTHRILYQHDESCGIIKPYCSAYSMYPLVIDGTSSVDGSKNKAPKHISSFCGQFQNLVFLLSAQKKGAGAYGEFFNFFSYYCEKEWGKDYWKNEDTVITTSACLHQQTIGDSINQYFQQVTHYINQSAGNRGWQSPFTNFNVFDRYYWNALFHDFAFPDGEKPNWDAVNWLQKRYMVWLNEERLHTLLTFPVVTVCLLTDGNDILDEEYKDFVTEQWAKGDSFFTYLSRDVDSISSCCRLRNEVTDNTFSSLTGLTGVQTGSVNVMTMNLNRIVQDWVGTLNFKVVKTNDSSTETSLFKSPEYIDLIRGEWSLNKETLKESLAHYIQSILDRAYDYQRAYRLGINKMDKRGMFPQSKAGYISFSRLYSTIGVNGLNEAARFLGYSISNNKDYMEFASWLLSVIKDYNKANSTKNCMFNLELVPAESLGVKNYNWDKADGYWVPDDENLYNSYIYDAHDNTSILDKIAMQGGQIAKSIDGGQASHLNLEENLSKEQYIKLLEYAVKVGNSYITFNVPQTQCDDCGFIAKHPFDICPKCNSENVTQWTRIIGYLRPTKVWSKERQLEGQHRYYAQKENVC